MVTSKPCISGHDYYNKGVLTGLAMARTQAEVMSREELIQWITKITRGNDMTPEEKSAICAMFTAEDGQPLKMAEGKAIKYDSNKQQYYAMPLKVMKGLAQVFAAGERKYETFNCLKPFHDGDRRLWDATMRHLSECQILPLALDEETGCRHGYQAAWNIIMRTYHAEQMEISHAEQRKNQMHLSS